MMSIFLNFNELVMFIVLIEFHFVSLDLMKSCTSFHKDVASMITKSLWQENNGEMLLFEAIEMNKPGDSDKADVGATGVNSFSS